MKTSVAVLVEVIDMLLRIFTCDPIRKTHFVISMSMKWWRLAKQYSLRVDMSHMGDWTRP